MTTPSHLALFDLDHTLLPFDSDYQWADFLARTGRAGDPAVAQARNDDLMRRYNLGTLSAEEAADFMLGLLRLAEPDELARWHQVYMDEVVLPGVLPAARALVTEHQTRGGLCAIVTATNAFVTGPIAQALGIRHLIATIPEQDAQGRYTGRIEGTPSFKAGKVLRVRQWLRGQGLQLEDFAESWFYSDSLNDLPLLEVVTHPVATNPSPALRELAEGRGWRVLELFSDMRDTKS
ncbi:HAD family hydrolase [Castellaniella caeni]|uniref:HAD family hydrolase n=1 Tax=Castellaniella caeni TaxID=266123 RepID=UPI000C9FEDB5|nr:HAD family hydrolase [Castellaniella caeni]